MASEPYFYWDEVTAQPWFNKEAAKRYHVEYTAWVHAVLRDLNASTHRALPGDWMPFARTPRWLDLEGPDDSVCFAPQSATKEE